MGESHKDKVAVVTGAAKGLGRAYAERLAAEGAHVVAVDIDDTGPTERAAAGFGVEAMGAAVDVADPASVGGLAETVQARFGRCDILVNNVGIFPNAPFAEIDFADWRRVMSVNLDSMFLMAKAFVPGMAARGWGRVVNMASNTVATTVTGYTHYAASKAGVIGFTRALASDMGGTGVTVNAIAPSLVRTYGTTHTEPRAEERFQAVANLQAIKRTQMPEDLVGVLAFLTSDDAAFMTGQTLYVDGGTVRS